MRLKIISFLDEFQSQPYFAPYRKISFESEVSAVLHVRIFEPLITPISSVPAQPWENIFPRGDVPLLC